jgi:C-terminal processing protease CtpA/Prc
MNRDLWLRRACWVGSVAVVLAVGTLVQAQDVLIRKGPAPGASDAFWLRHAPLPARFGGARDVLYLVDADEGEAAAPAYWIGLICDPADAVLRAHLKLKDTGLVVRHVVPDAPAAKAGVKEHDLLLAVSDKEVSDVRGLVDAVEKSEGKEITLALLRDGEKTTIKVIPAKRDKAARVDDLPADVRAWIRKYPLGPDGWHRIETMRPGMIGLTIKAGAHKLPKDMTVTITKEGEAPAKIVVKQGDKTWEITEDKLKDLPDEVRKHITPMVRPGTGFFEKALPAPPGAPFEFELSRPGADRRLEKQVDELRKQLDQINKKLEELSKKGEK